MMEKPAFMFFFLFLVTDNSANVQGLTHYCCNNMAIVWLFTDEKTSQHPWGGGGVGREVHRCSWSAFFSCKDSLKPKRVDDGLAQDRADGTTAVGPRRSILHPGSESPTPNSLPVRMSPPANLSLEAHLRRYSSRLGNIIIHNKRSLKTRKQTPPDIIGDQNVFFTTNF